MQSIWESKKWTLPKVSIECIVIQELVSVNQVLLGGCDTMKAILQKHGFISMELYAQVVFHRYETLFLNVQS